MILAIRRFPDPILRERGSHVPNGAVYGPLINDMIETMHAAGGAGLAATQVGWPLSLIVLDRGGPQFPALALFNPVLLEARGQVVDVEGCLSFPEMLVRVPRYEQVHFTGRERDGTKIHLYAEGFFARVLQHELDHVDGVLFIDRGV